MSAETEPKDVFGYRGKQGGIHAISWSRSDAARNADMNGGTLVVAVLPPGVTTVGAGVVWQDVPR